MRWSHVKDFTRIALRQIRVIKNGPTVALNVRMLHAVYDPPRKLRRFSGESAFIAA